MKRWLILALGTLLILILSYITFLNKKESITHELLSQAQIIKKNPAFKDVYIKLKGEGFALTREIMLLGSVSSEEEKALASNLLKDIKGITKVNNILKVKTLKPIIKEVEIANTPKEVLQEEQKVDIATTEISKEENSSYDLNRTKITLEDSNISTKDKNNTTELNSTNQQAIEKIDTNLTKENNEINQSNCQEQLNNILSKRKIQFAHNSSNIEKSSYQQLDQISTILKECSSNIIIDGYSDNRGNAKYNQRLSQQRANKVKLYLISKGIDKKSIKAFGHGAENPIASNATKQGREQNRRIEFTIKRIK